jgi:protein TonB
MAALLLVGSDASIRIDDHRTRSRRFLQRGLLLSGLIHLSVLFAFLSLTNHGDEELVRLIEKGTYVIPPPTTEIALPPSDGGAPPTSSYRRGIIDPVPPKIDTGPLELPPNVFFPANPRESSGPRTNRDVETPPSSGPPPVYLIDKVDEPPVAIYSPKPVYPEIAREIVFTGRVVLRVLVGEDGNVRKVEVVSGPRLLAESAQETLYRWRFRPARVKGKAVPVSLEVPVNFVM